MALPDYKSLMLPLLEYASDGQTSKFGDAVGALAARFKITEEELRLLLPSGRYPVFRSRVGWAKTYLTKALLLEAPSRGSFRITQRGLNVLEQKPAHIDDEFLAQFSEFLAFKQKPSAEVASSKRKNIPISIFEPSSQEEKTPDELLEYAYLELQKSLAQDLLQQIQRCSSQFFEVLVVDVLVAMGYGGSMKDAAQVVGKSGDGGIDGIIKEDRLGLDVIYIQAKRWDENSSISRPEIQKFVGALHGHHASKGVFLTTGRFTESAKAYVKTLPSKVVLIDGEQLAKFMIDFNVGVTPRISYEVKRIDIDYFLEE